MKKTLILKRKPKPTMVLTRKNTKGYTPTNSSYRVATKKSSRKTA